MLINIAINCEIIKHSRGYTLQRKTKLRKNRYKIYAKSTQQNAFHFIDTDTFQSEGSFKVVIRE